VAKPIKRGIIRAKTALDEKQGAEAAAVETPEGAKPAAKKRQSRPKSLRDRYAHAATVMGEYKGLGL
jgi:hypothetical protein